MVDIQVQHLILILVGDTIDFSKLKFSGRMLGSGGSSRVEEATYLDTPVAVKKLAACEDKYAKQLLTEITLLR
jgi:hypothetical protein